MKESRTLKVEAYIQVNGETVKVEDLSEERQLALAVWLKQTWLNNLFPGKIRWEEQA